MRSWVSAQTVRQSLLDSARKVAALKGRVTSGGIVSTGETIAVFEKLTNNNTNGGGTGGVLLGLSAQGGEVKSQELYFSKDMQNHHGVVVLVNGYLYGFSGSGLTCLEFATGKKMWANRSVGKGALTYASNSRFRK